jgi:hypothetical protein
MLKLNLYLKKGDKNVPSNYRRWRELVEKAKTLHKEL